MSLPPTLDDAERSADAAELALRLIDGDELREARARVIADPAFAAALDDWNARLAPLFDDIPAAEPDASIWERIAASLSRQRDLSNQPVAGDAPDLAHRVRFWRRTSAAMTALAASLALVAGYQAVNRATPAPVAAPTRELLVAAVAAADAQPLALVSYDRRGQRLEVRPAALEAVAGRSHELWVVPASGTPYSLGLLQPGAPTRIVLADDLAGYFAGAPTIAISREREGGSRTGAPQGPIIASGTLDTI